MADKLEFAKSNRATCKSCKEKIAKDEVRFGLESVFKKDGKEYPSYKWYHFTCAVDKFPEKVTNAEGAEILTTEQKKIYEELVRKYSFSNFSLKQVGDLTGEEGIASIEAFVLKVMPVRLLNNPKLEEKEGRIIYVEDTNGERRKLFLWKSLDEQIKAGDKLVVENAQIEVGNDDLPEIHVIGNANLQINPTTTSTLQFEKFTSTAWERPSSSFAHFEYAKSNRAGCTICKERISKSSLKLVKPVWGENETTGQKFPANQSFHVMCIFADEYAEDVLHEAISRLNPPLVNENIEIFQKVLATLSEKFPNAPAYSLLQQILA